jgi:hypothetical protein
MRTWDEALINRREILFKNICFKKSYEKTLHSSKKKIQNSNEICKTFKLGFKAFKHFSINNIVAQSIFSVE